MNCYTDIAKSIPEFRSLVTAIHKRRLPLGVTGLAYIHKAHVISSLCTGFKKRALVLVPDESQASRLVLDLESLGMRAYVFPARDISYRTDETVSREYEHRRLHVLDKMLTGNYDVIAASSEAAMQLTVPPETLMSKSLTIRAGEQYDMYEVAFKLTESGYTRAPQIDGRDSLP